MSPLQNRPGGWGLWEDYEKSTLGKTLLFRLLVGAEPPFEIVLLPPFLLLVNRLLALEHFLPSL